MDKKNKKAKGPLRLEAIIPVAIIVTLTVVYFKFFFDSNLKAGIEWVGTQVNGAEVNVGSVNTSFLRGSFALHNLQVTDKENPDRNLVQVGRIHFQFLWDALLRAKFVVEDASIDNIQAFSPRARRGYVVPPPPPNTEPKALDKIEQKALEQARSQYNNNILGDVATVLGGTDPSEQIKNIQAQLKSEAAAKELDKALKEKEKAWKERLATLPQAKEFEQLAEKAKKLKFNSKNPLEVAAAIAEADKIIKEADQKIKAIQKTGKDLTGDIDLFSQSIKDLEKMAQDDLKDLQTRLKIPDLDMKDFSRGLFMSLMAGKIASFQKYMAVAREYMPPKKSKEEREAEKIIPPPRGAGKDFRFPITTGYPLFWLKRAAISSEPNQSEYSGRIQGEIRDVTTNPVQLGRPMIATLKGDFPRQKVMGFDSKLTIDHTTNDPYESLVVSVASYPVDRQVLSEGSDVSFAMANAQGEAHLEGLLKNSEMTLKLKNYFKEINYEISAKNKMVEEIIRNVVTGIPVVTVNAKVQGTWTDFKVGIDSNLGDDLAKGFKAELAAKLEEAKKKLKAFIDDRIKGEKAKLEAEFNKIKSQVTGQFESKKKELDKAKQQAEAQIKGNKKANDPKKKAENDLKKALGL